MPDEVARLSVRLVACVLSCALILLTIGAASAADYTPTQEAAAEPPARYQQPMAFQPQAAYPPVATGPAPQPSPAGFSQPSLPQTVMTPAVAVQQPYAAPAVVFQPLSPALDRASHEASASLLSSSPQGGPQPMVQPVASFSPPAGGSAPSNAVMSAGAAPPATGVPPGSFLASFNSAQNPNEPPAPSGALPYGDILRRLEAAEAELNAMQQQMAPNEKRVSELEEAGRKAAAMERPLPIVRLSGFFQYDTGWFSQDVNSKEVLGNIQNGSGFRRTRLQGLGQLTEFTTFSIEMDFAFPGRPSFMDVWGEQSNLPLLGRVRIGQYRQPVTMDSWTNVKHLEFLERSAPFIAMDPFRRVGIMGADTSEDERTMWAYSLFGTGWTFWNGAATQYSTEGNDNRFGTQLGDSGGVSFAARAAHLLYYDPNPNAKDRYLMHIGGGYLFGELGGEGTTGPNAKAYEARSIPEFFVGDQGGGFLTAAGTPNVVDTGRFLATNYQMLHAELAGSWGPAHYQAEYMATFVQQLGGGLVFLDGGYVQGGYFLTGENTGYNKLLGALDYNVTPHTDFFGIGRKKPICGWGAWELAARWSWLDLSSTQVRAANYLPGQTVAPPTPVVAPPPIINPGVLNEPTVALNWWWNQYMRVQFNYIHSMVQSNNTGFYSTDIFALRFQTEF